MNDEYDKYDELNEESDDYGPSYHFQIGELHPCGHESAPDADGYIEYCIDGKGPWLGIGIPVRCPRHKL